MIYIQPYLHRPMPLLSFNRYYVQLLAQFLMHCNFSIHTTHIQKKKSWKFYHLSPNFFKNRIILPAFYDLILMRFIKTFVDKRFFNEKNLVDTPCVLRGCYNDMFAIFILIKDHLCKNQNGLTFFLRSETIAQIVNRLITWYVIKQCLLIAVQYTRYAWATELENSAKRFDLRHTTMLLVCEVQAYRHICGLLFSCQVYILICIVWICLYFCYLVTKFS